MSGNGQNLIYAFFVQQIFCFFNRLLAREVWSTLPSNAELSKHRVEQCRFLPAVGERFLAMKNFWGSMRVAHAAISPFKGRKNICLRIQTMQAINRQKTTRRRKYKI